MSYDINLKKTQLGYQFDRNVYIGYQTNDNRVVTVKELKGYVGGSGGGGGGGGGIQSITLGGGNGVVTLQVDQLNPQSVTVTNVVAEGTVPTGTDPYVCIIAQSGTGYKVYPTDKTWNELLASIPEITWNAPDQELLSIKVNGTTKTLILGTGLKKTPNDNSTTLSLTNNVVLGLSIGNNGLSYSDSDGNTHTLGGTIGTTAVTTLSIATRGSQSPSDDAIPTIGYIKSAGLGGNVYSTANDPSNPIHTSDENTKFIFVEEN